MRLAAQAFSRVKKDNPIYLVGLGHGATHWVIATFYFLGVMLLIANFLVLFIPKKKLIQFSRLSLK